MKKIKRGLDIPIEGSPLQRARPSGPVRLWAAPRAHSLLRKQPILKGYLPSFPIGFSAFAS